MVSGKVEDGNEGLPAGKLEDREAEDDDKGAVWKCRDIGSDQW